MDAQDQDVIQLINDINSLKGACWKEFETSNSDKAN